MTDVKTDGKLKYIYEYNVGYKDLLYLSLKSSYIENFSRLSNMRQSGHDYIIHGSPASSDIILGLNSHIPLDKVNILVQIIGLNKW